MRAPTVVVLRGRETGAGRGFSVSCDETSAVVLMGEVGDLSEHPNAVASPAATTRTMALRIETSFANKETRTEI
jgi:hypothetical protein